jgi:hypothetical protein
MFFFKSDTNSASYQIQAIKMSSSRNTANTTTAPAKPFCKVCRDAGKLESEYTSHFVKDQPGPNGKVICPTLLNQACRICDKTGHTSSYCPQYRRREEPRREEPRREERYIAREEPRREERYIAREERYIARERGDREERYIARERGDREERYIAREEPRCEEPRRDRGGSYDRLREDTERREREIRHRDDEYYREKDRRSKPWLQAALKKPEQEQQRREPYAHPHGPRVRLNLEAPALCVDKHATAAATAAPLPTIDVRKVELNHASAWGDEDETVPFVCDPEQMTRAFFQTVIMTNLTTNAEDEFMAACDDQSEMPFFCGQ